jgi:two-component system response regulator YesN
MFRVLIIDDEPIVREGLKSVIEWEELGFTVCWDGADGNDGLNKILQLKPDLTMIDIKMPGLYGIQVIEQAQEQGYKGKFIILTGYSDFKDAQSAVRLGIHSFLLKPIDENELVESLIKLKKNISAEYEARIYLNQNLKTVKESIITDILCSKGEHLHKDDYMRLYGLDMNYQVYQVAIIKSVRGDDYRQEVIKTFFSCEKDIDPVIIGEIVVLVLKGNSKLRLNEMLNLLPKTVLINDDIQIFTGVGRAVIDINDITN